MSTWWDHLFHEASARGANSNPTPQFNPSYNPYSNRYPAGPTGTNGTQQFAKLKDSQLFEAAKAWAGRGFWKQYYSRENIKESTRKLINNLPSIIKEAAGILLEIKKQYGYDPDETVSAIKRHLWQNEMVSKNPAMRMFIAAFGIASILLEVNPNATPKTAPTPQRNPRARGHSIVFTWPRYAYNNPYACQYPNPTDIPTATPVPYASPIPYATLPNATPPNQEEKTKQQRSEDLADLLEAYQKQIDEYTAHHKKARQEFEELYEI